MVEYHIGTVYNRYGREETNLSIIHAQNDVAATKKWREYLSDIPFKISSSQLRQVLGKETKLVRAFVKE